MIDTHALDADTSRAATAELLDHPEALRDVLRTLAAAAGYHSTTVIEWCSADAPGTPTDIPPLYYAAVRPDDADTDMPLGLGDSPSAALADLIWTLGSPALLADVLAQRASHPPHTETDELSASEEH
jgi:hypothetical protein